MKEEKSLGGLGAPLFPRLHVNDADKGGPRAPPRNKMALYEQLSVPTPRSDYGSLPNRPSSSQGGGCGRYVVSQFYACPPTSTCSTEKVKSCSSNTPLVRDANFSSVNATEPFALTAECSSFAPRILSKSKNSGGKKLDDEEAGCSTLLPRNDLSKTATAICSSSMQVMQLDKAINLQLKGCNSKGLTPEKPVKNQIIDYPEVETPSAINSTSHLLHGQKSKTDEHSKKAVTCLDQDCQSTPVNDLRSIRDMDAQLQQAYRLGLLQESVACSDRIPTEPSKSVERNVSSVRSESCSSTSIRHDFRSPKEIHKTSEDCDDEAHMPYETDEVDRNDDTSEASMVQSISGMDITADDVVDIIGQQHFWKARRVILNQQRAFASQVFELHRLIEVQRLFAGLPNLLEENSGVSKSFRKLPNECILKSLDAKSKNDSQKPNQSLERGDENTVENHQPNSQVSKGINKELSEYSSYLPQHSNGSSFSGNAPLSLLPSNNNAGPWSFQLPPGNQWLVPVMSPSEGLIYKPYAGPFPPSAGSMAQIYGGSTGPINASSIEGRNLNSSYGTSSAPLPHPASRTFPASTILPSYCMPVPSPGNWNTVFNLTALPGAAMLGQAEQFQSQSNSLNNGNQAAFCCAGKSQAYKTSERHGNLVSHSSASTQELCANRVSEGRTALPLFPMDSPLAKPPQNRSQQKSVIRVVPYNPISATASAARIFQSIQAERRQCDTS